MSVNYTKTYLYNLFLKTKKEFQEMDIQELYLKLSKKDMARIPVEIWNNLSLQQVYESSVSNLSYLPMKSLLFLLKEYQHINDKKTITKTVGDKTIEIQSDTPKDKLEKAIMILNRRTIGKREISINNQTVFQDNEYITFDKCCYYFSVTEKNHLKHLDRETGEMHYLPLYKRPLNFSIFTTYDDLVAFVKLCRVGDEITEIPERLDTFIAILEKTNILNRNITQIVRYLPHYRLCDSLRFDYKEVRDIIYEKQLASFRSYAPNIKTLEEAGRIPKAFAYYFLYNKMSKEEFDEIIQKGQIKLYNNEAHLLDYSSFMAYYNSLL